MGRAEGDYLLVMKWFGMRDETGRPDESQAERGGAGKGGHTTRLIWYGWGGAGLCGEGGGAEWSIRYERWKGGGQCDA